MCVVSMVMEHKTLEWSERYRLGPSQGPLQDPFVPLPTPQEIEEFRKLLERAREYDRKHHEPDCELESKRQRLRDLAKELGVEIEFV